MFRIDDGKSKDGKSKEREPLFPKSERKMGGPMDCTREYQLMEAELAIRQERANKQAERARERLKKLPKL